MGNRAQKIFEVLSKYKSCLEKEYGYKVAYIALYGSDNYNLSVFTDDYSSDIDAKAIIVPTLDDLIYNSKPVSKVHEMEEGQIDVKDIRSFFETLVKANPAYIETLFTDYFIIDTDFKGELEHILSLRDDLVYILRCQFIRAIYGMMLEKQNAMCHPYPSIKEKIEKYGFDGKQVSHCIRLYDVMMRYFNDGEFLDDALVPIDDMRNLILRHKLNISSLEEAKSDCELYVSKAKELKDRVLAGIDEQKIDYSIKDVFIDLSRQILKKKIVQEVMDGMI